MLSVWWAYKGILHFELLPRNQTINSKMYAQQLAKLSDEVQEKRPELANHKDAVFQHLSIQTPRIVDHSPKSIGTRLGCAVTSNIQP